MNYAIHTPRVDVQIDLPLYLPLGFILIALLTVFLFVRSGTSTVLSLVVVGWTILHSVLGILGVYQDTESLPPRLMLMGIFPAVIFIVFLLSSQWGRKNSAAFQAERLTHLHIIRIPVEISLSLIYHAGLMSVYITYEGTNFDLFSGITAPIVAYFVFRSGKLSKRVLLIWNFICLGLLLNVVVTAIFAFPSPLQKIAFDQPNVAVLFFPFNLLPTLIVPLVLFSHLVVIRQLLKK